MQKNATTRDDCVSAIAFVLSAAGREVRKMIGKLIVHCVRGDIVQRVLQNGAWQSRVLVIQGNKRIPRAKSHLNWNRRVADLDLGKRIFTFEFGHRETRETFETSASIAFAL